MNKVLNELDNLRVAASKLMKLEEDYWDKTKGSIYEMRLLNLTKKVKYYETKIKNLGKTKIAVVRVTFYDKNNILIKKKFRLVGLDEQEIETLCKTRIPQGYLTKKVKFLASGF